METRSRSNKLKIEYYCINREDNKIKVVLQNTVRSRIAINFLLFFALIIFFAILTTIILLFFESFNFAPGLLVSWIIGGWVSGYLFKLYLWNKYGKDVFIITDGSLEVYNDYKYFKDGNKKYSFASIEVKFESRNFLTNAFDLVETHSFTVNRGMKV